MFQGLDIPEGPTGCTESGIVCEMSGIKNHFNAKSDCVCEGQFQMKADGFITGDGLSKDSESWAVQVWNEDGFQVLNARNDQ